MQTSCAHALRSCALIVDCCAVTVATCAARQRACQLWKGKKLMPGILNERGALLTRVLPDGRVIDVVPLTFGRARLIVSGSITDQSYADGW